MTARTAGSPANSPADSPGSTPANSPGSTPGSSPANAPGSSPGAGPSASSPGAGPSAGGEIDQDADLVATLRALREAGRFEQAAAVVRAADAERPAAAMGAEAHAAAGATLAAVSDHVGAEVHLVLASAEPALAPAALTGLAELAWVRHEHARGRELALSGLALDPSHRGCRIQLQRNEIRSDPERAEPPHRSADGEARAATGLSHAAFFADPQGNAGDRVLTDAVRRCFRGVAGVTGTQDARARDRFRADGATTDRTLGGPTTTDRTSSDRALGDRALGDRAVGGRTVGDQALADRTVGERTVGDRIVSDRDEPGWHPVHVHQLFDERSLARVNATAGLILGGGGLFLPDTAPNGNSGWQWNVTEAVLARIDVPLVVFAVGYNMFTGQTFEDASAGGRFARSLRALVERATFVGLRNHGSVQRVRDLLPADLAGRIRWQPCPTAFGDLLADPTDSTDSTDFDDPTDPGYPGYPGGGRAGGTGGDPGTGPGGARTGGDPGGARGHEARDVETPSGAVLLNCAYDRAGRRFGDGYRGFLDGLRDWIVRTRERADVRFAAHCVDDERFVTDLRRVHGLTLPVVPMYDLPPERIRAHYRRAGLAVGMRGHAGMIPFGCGTPIISLISHPKLGYFLADIDRPQWGVDVRDPHLAGRLGELTGDLLDHAAPVAADIAAIRGRLLAVTEANLRSLPASLQPPQPPARTEPATAGAGGTAADRAGFGR